MIKMTDAEELIELERLERNPEYQKFEQWKEDNMSTLEGEFIESKAPEDQPLDDDIPDFMEHYADEFDDFCVDRYKEVEE